MKLSKGSDEAKKQQAMSRVPARMTCRGVRAHSSPWGSGKMDGTRHKEISAVQKNSWLAGEVGPQRLYGWLFDDAHYKSCMMHCLPAATLAAQHAGV